MENIDQIIYENQLAPLFINLQAGLNMKIPLVAMQVEQALKRDDLKPEDKALIEFLEPELRGIFPGSAILSDEFQQIITERKSRKEALPNLGKRLKKIRSNFQTKLYQCAPWSELMN